MMGIYLYGIEMAEEYPIPFFKNPVRLFYFNPYPPSFLRISVVACVYVRKNRTI